MKISVCGKGGSGKSTVTALLARQALGKKRAVLVVDADDSNSGLFRMLRFDDPPAPLMDLAGGRAGIKGKMKSNALLTRKEIHIQDIPTEYIKKNDGLMHVRIGKILQALEGCACPMGALSREFLKKLCLDTDEIAIVDMEAGIEHFGRGVDEAVDHVLIVIEPSYESVTMAEKIAELSAGMKRDVSAILNKIPSKAIADKVKDKLNANGIPVIGTISNDPQVFDACLEGLAPEKGQAFDEAGKILDMLLSKKVL